MEIKNDLLQGETIKLEKSPSHGGEFESGYPDTIIIHYTGGPAKAAINSFTNPRTKVSAHLVVARDGSITQLVPFDTVAWHAGKSSYNGRSGFNKYSIGIEVENAGVLKKSGEVYRSWFGATYEPSEVIEATHRNQVEPKYWHTYTEEQINTVKDICRLLIDNYNIKQILGHEEISPNRKTDPGPAFPLDRLREELLQGDRDVDEPEETPPEGRVMIKKLNIRTEPDTNADKAAIPLVKGSKVKILDQANGWYKVLTEIEGWVYGKYIETE